MSEMYPHINELDSEPWENGDIMNISSGMDCTGLIPSAVKSDTEEENYSELYNYLPNPVSNGDFSHD